MVMTSCRCLGNYALNKSTCKDCLPPWRTSLNYWARGVNPEKYQWMLSKVECICVNRVINGDKPLRRFFKDYSIIGDDGRLLCTIANQSHQILHIYSLYQVLSLPFKTSSSDPEEPINSYKYRGNP